MRQSKPRPLDKTLLRLLLERLFLPSLVVTLAAVGLTGYLWGRGLGIQQLQLARSLAHTTDDYLEHASRVLDAVSQVAEAATPEELAPYMQATWQSYGYFDTLYRLDENGVIVLLAPPNPQYQGLDMSDQPYFQPASAQTGATISQPFTSPHTGQPTVYMTQPLAGGGMIVGALNLGELHEAIVAVSGEQHSVFVVERSGALLAHPQSDRVDQMDNVGRLEIVQRGLKGEATMLYSDDGTFVLGSVAQTERTGWLVVAQIPLSTAYAPYAWAMGIALVLAPIVWLAMILDFGQQLERNVATPLARLSQETKALAAGDSASGAALTATPAAFSEIAALVADFERMSQAIQARQDALRESEARFRSVVQTATDAIISVDGHGHITFWNHAAETMFGYSPDEIAGEPATSILSERFHKAYRSIIKRVDATGEASLVRKMVEMVGLRKDGSEFPLEISWATWETRGGAFVTGIVRDISERKRAEEEARRRATQAALIYEVGQRVSGQLELDALLSEITAAVRGAFDYYNVILLLLDEKTGRLTLQSIAGGYAGAFPDGLWLAIGEGLTGHAAATGETQASGDVSQNPHYVRKAQEKTRSELAVPVKSGGQVIGVLDIQSEELDAFDESDVVAMETLSTQIGIAIENARLLKDVRAHVEELAVLNELGQALTTRLDVEQVLDEAYRGASRLMDTANFYIVLYNPDKDEITFALDVVDGEIQKPHVTLRAGRGLAEHVIRSRAPLLITENLPELLKEMGVELGRRSALSWVGAPLIVGDRVLGMMAAVQSHAGSPAYDERDRDLLLAVANQTAIALQNAYLFEETQRRVTQLALINDVGEKIAAVLELESVLDRAARLVQESFGYHRVGLFTLDRERDELVMRARAGDFAHLVPLDHRLKLGQGIVGWVGRHCKGLLVNDVDDEPRYVNLYPDAAPTCSELSVPIGVGGEAVGVLDIQSPHPNAFDEGDVMAMETLADQIAVAIDNARLYEAIERELAERKQAEEALARHNRELALLNRAGQAFGSTLDLDQVLVAVLEETRRLLGVTACSIWLVDQESKEIVCQHVIGSQSDAVRGWRLTPGEGFVGWVVRNDESLIVPDAQVDERYFKDVDRQTGLSLRSILSVPLRAKQEVIGVLQVLDTGVGSFDAADVALVEPLAAAASIAIENARLHREVLDYAGQLEQRVQERTAQLQTQYARLERILSSVSDGIIVASAQGELILANPVAQTWLNQTLSPEDAAQLRETVQDLAQRAEERPESVLELTGLDLELKAAPVVEEEAKKHVVVVAVHDVSHLKALDRVKTRFVSNVSHELRTPITTIKLYANLMRRKPEKWEQYLDVLAGEADRQARLVEDILQISRIDAGRLDLKPQPVSLNELTESVVVNLQVLAQDQGLVLEHRPADTPEGEPGPMTLADRKRMMQALSNLVENAIHYTPEGGKVTVSTEKVEAEGRTWATVTVADTGMGIPEEELPHIFERFFRGVKPQSMQISGTGLGLAIVKEIVELHGGRVAVESKVDVGATFTVWLSLADRIDQQ